MRSTFNAYFANSSLALYSVHTYLPKYDEEMF